MPNIFLHRLPAFLCLLYFVLINKLENIVLEGFGNRDGQLAVNHLHSLDGVEVGHVGKIGTVNPLELLPRQLLLQSFQVAQRRDAFFTLQMKHHVILQTLDEENLLEGNAYVSGITLYDQELIALDGIVHVLSLIHI